jgi:hypothetical protein
MTPNAAIPAALVQSANRGRNYSIIATIDSENTDKPFPLQDFRAGVLARKHGVSRDLAAIAAPLASSRGARR